jgi:hypothetical protein
VKPREYGRETPFIYGLKTNFSNNNKLKHRSHLALHKRHPLNVTYKNMT